MIERLVVTRTLQGVTIALSSHAVKEKADNGEGAGG